jgi:periplasmic protein TonB
MPLKVRRLWLSYFVLGVVAAGAAPAVLAQENIQQQPTGATTAVATPAATTATVAAPKEATKESAAQQRIARVRAMIAARNFGGASVELEKMRKENAADESMQQVARVMLMSVYLEQPDYARAQALLEESFKRRNGAANDTYFAVAGQLIKSSNAQLERYKKLGINLSDASLAAELCNDLGKWHALLELIIEQAKESSLKAKQPAEPLALLEAAATARGALARDEYETARWKNELNDTRELMANAQMKVEEVDASVAAPSGTLIASNLPMPSVFKQPDAPKSTLPAASAPQAENKPVAAAAQQIATGGQTETLNQTIADKSAEPEIKNAKPAETVAAPQNTQRELNVTNQAPTAKTENKPDAAKTDKPANTTAATNSSAEPMSVGSLVDMATSKVNPSYPAMAKNARVSGVVKVEIVLNENGEVADVRGAAGPQMLQRAAIDAVRRWKFKPVTRDGQPVRASGFVNFNFTL